MFAAVLCFGGWGGFYVILCNQHMKSCKCANGVFETELSDGAVTLSQVTSRVVCIEFEVGHMTVARMPPGDVLPLEFPSIKMHFYHPLAHGFWYH